LKPFEGCCKKENVMRKIVIVSVFLLFISFKANAQWVAQTSGTNQSLNSTYFISATQGWAVGDNGTILTTANGGVTWSQQSSGTIQNLKYVCFISSNLGWAVGDGGTILETNNSGSNWNMQTSGTLNDLSYFCFISPSQGWAVGGNVILTTKNGGSTWSLQYTGTKVYLNYVNFTTATEGLVIDGEYGKTLTTTNGGNSWDVKYSSGVSTYGINSPFFISPSQGWAVANYYSNIQMSYIEAILNTSDSGNFWSEPFNYQPPGIPTFNSVYFFSPSQGWVVGSGGLILSTADSGKTWNTQSSGTNKELGSTFFTSQSEGWIVGDSGTILHTTNGGNPTGIPEIIDNIHFKIFPNPASYTVTVKSSITNPYNLQLLNLLGQVVCNPVIVTGQEFTLDVSGLPKGIYVIQLTDVQNNTAGRQKLVVQ